MAQLPAVEKSRGEESRGEQRRAEESRGEQRRSRGGAEERRAETDLLCGSARPRDIPNPNGSVSQAQASACLSHYDGREASGPDLCSDSLFPSQQKREKRKDCVFTFVAAAELNTYLRT